MISLTINRFIRDELCSTFPFTLTLVHVSSDCLVYFSLKKLDVRFVKVEVLFHISSEGLYVVFVQVVFECNGEHSVFGLHINNNLENVVAVLLLAYVYTLEQRRCVLVRFFNACKLLLCRE